MLIEKPCPLLYRPWPANAGRASARIEMGMRIRRMFPPFSKALDAGFGGEVSEDAHGDGKRVRLAFHETEQGDATQAHEELRGDSPAPHRREGGAQRPV